MVFATVSLALALSAHTLRVPLSVHDAKACGHSGLGWDTTHKSLALAGNPVNYC